MTSVQCKEVEWPYPVNYGNEIEVRGDVLIVGSGIAGCYAAISAARKGAKVIAVDKSDIKISGSGGAGVDHWHFACTNPCCKVPDLPFICIRAIEFVNAPEISGFVFEATGVEAVDIEITHILY